ncbi:hypothetical protein [Blautia sp. MSJ-19]|uniref:hypothetical protein n=1 Tax=Blautia sp. MSJ-19 TaxID=2841517 RepID=UPI001C0ECF6A|nr:hypothetical protein [Blautia sp. MSJ-19]MBU5482542.1 hypothetical protein [Blautia sp. MSJ-19]
MKNKMNPAAVLLIITGIVFISGIFVIGNRTRQQIQATTQSLSTFSDQVKMKQQEIIDSQSAFSDAIQKKKELITYQKQKSAPSQTSVQEHREVPDITQEPKTSVFSQDHN